MNCSIYYKSVSATCWEKKKKNKHLKCAVTVPKMPMVYLLQMITFFVVVPLCRLCKI